MGAWKYNKLHSINDVIFRPFEATPVEKAKELSSSIFNYLLPNMIKKDKRKVKAKFDIETFYEEYWVDKDKIVMTDDIKHL